MAIHSHLTGVFVDEHCVIIIQWCHFFFLMIRRPPRSTLFPYTTPLPIFFAILGVLGLIGMNIKNAIVLVDQIGIEEEKGTPRLEAIIEATKSRIVPVAMASGTTILGMLPLLFDAMFGGMAACIMGGLLVASLLTIFVLPVTYSLLFRVKVTDTPEVRMNEE